MSNDKPTIYLSNWSSHKTPGHHGPGKKYTIMALFRRWEMGDGIVSWLVPEIEWVRDFKEGWLTLRAYRELFESMMREDDEELTCLQEGILEVIDLAGDTVGRVKDGDTLCCACSREAASRGECHRVWAAELLKEAGWRVILDGVEI